MDKTILGTYEITGKELSVLAELGEEVMIERYGVWGRKPHVVDQGSDLEELKRKYATPKLITIPNGNTQV